MKQVTLVTILLLTLIACDNYNITQPEPTLTEYPPRQYDSYSPFTLTPEPYATISPTQTIQIRFKSRATNVKVNGTTACCTTGYYYEWKPYYDDWKTAKQDSTGDLLNLTITYSLFDKDGNAYEAPPINAGPYTIGELDSTPPQITHSSVLNNNRGGKPYPPWVTRIDGRTDIDPDTLIITVTFDEPGGWLYLHKADKPITAEISSLYENKNLWWYNQEPIGTNVATLMQYTPEHVAKIIDETSVTKQMWVGTPLDTPAHEVKGKFVEIKIPTISGLEPSTPLEPNSTYYLEIQTSDKAGNSNHIIITFGTGN